MIIPEKSILLTYGQKNKNDNFLHTLNIKQKMLPLFDNLYRETESNDLLVTHKATTIKNIKKIDLQGHEMVYVIIKLFEQKENVKVESKVVKNQLTFDLESMPNKLKQIIYKFTQLHLKKMEEEIRLSVERLV